LPPVPGDPPEPDAAEPADEPLRIADEAPALKTPMLGPPARPRLR
jgi:hypothetical protein